jgi:hypothetical protein
VAPKDTGQENSAAERVRSLLSELGPLRDQAIKELVAQREEIDRQLAQLGHIGGRRRRRPRKEKTMEGPRRRGRPPKAGKKTAKRGRRGRPRGRPRGRKAKKTEQTSAATE